MEIYLMGPAGGTKKYLVVILDSTYKKYTLQEIENMVCYSNHVHVTGVGDGLEGISEVCLVDVTGIRRFEIEEEDSYGTEIK